MQHLQEHEVGFCCQTTSPSCLSVSVAIHNACLSHALPAQKECIGRTIGGGGLPRQTKLRLHFCRSRLRGRVRWVSFLVAGSSSSRALPFFVPTSNGCCFPCFRRWRVLSSPS